MEEKHSMKVTLINPNQNFLIDKSMSEPLGLMYIEEVLLNKGVEVNFVDLSFDKIIPDADMYCFTSSTASIKDVIKIAGTLDGYKVLGGPHASALPTDSLNHFDAVVVGAGDKAILDIVDDFNNKQSGGIFKREVKKEDILIPSRPILNRLVYTVTEPFVRSATVMSSRGCPNRCSFCASNVIWGRHVTFFDIESVIIEIKYLRDKFNIYNFKFIDDVFTLNKDRFLNLAGRLNKLGIAWTCNTRVDLLDVDIVDSMKKGGCTCIDLGVESIEDRVLKGIHKHQTVQNCVDAIELIKSKNIKVKVYIVSGLPFESDKIVQNTIEFIKKTNPDQVMLYTLIPYPGTDIWNNPDKYNVTELLKDFSLYRHYIGRDEKELTTMFNLSYKDKSFDELRNNRNKLKRFCNKWNRDKL